MHYNRITNGSGAGESRRIGKRGENPPRPRHCERSQISVEETTVNLLMGRFSGRKIGSQETCLDRVSRICFRGKAVEQRTAVSC